MDSFGSRVNQHHIGPRGSQSSMFIGLGALGLGGSAGLDKGLPRYDRFTRQWINATGSLVVFRDSSLSSLKTDAELKVTLEILTDAWVPHTWNDKTNRPCPDKCSTPRMTLCSLHLWKRRRNINDICGTSGDVTTGYSHYSLCDWPHLGHSPIRPNHQYLIVLQTLTWYLGQQRVF